MNGFNTVEHAIIHKQAWKSPILDRYVTGFLRAALRLQADGIEYFNNDDVPDCYQAGDGTTVGAAVKLLLMEHIIAPWYGTVEAAGIIHGRRRSTRPENHGHKNQLYTLTNLGIAREWLARHGSDVAVEQGELFELEAAR
jgi:hypothetical protein